MTDLTREQLEALLDGATRGPWQADGDPWNRIVWSSAENRVCFMAHTNGLDDARDIATSDLVAAAPDLARQLLATMTERDEAQAAQAGVVERAAKLCDETADEALETSGECTHRALSLWFRGQAKSIRALADPTGVKLLAELRAERDSAIRGRNEWRDDYKALAKAIVGETGLSAMTVAAQARLYRPRAETAEAQLAEAQKREAGLRAMIRVNMLRYGPADLTHEDIDRQIGAALSAAPTGEESNG